MLSKHVNPDQIIEQAADHPHLNLLQKAGAGDTHVNHSNIRAGRYQIESVPKFTLPKDGISEEAAYHLLSDEITLDARPNLNLASFVHTSLPEWCERLVDETKYINIVDQDEYPATLQIHGRCISQLADLWHAPQTKDKDGNVQSAFGTACTGSSEAIMLGGLAMKKRWQAKRQAQGKPWKGLGNLVFGSNAQVAIEKFARYFDLEMRLVPTSKESHYRMDPQKAVQMVDEETVGVIVILGSTYTGHYEPVEEMSKLLDDLQTRTGLDVPIHVDGASGGMVAPFATPNLKWDFQIPRVVSINTSGHKFGMTNVGLGWIIFRNPDVVPKELVFELHYLGSVEYSFGLNFSRPANQVLAQAFRFLSLGFNGYQEVMSNNLKNARLLSRALELSGKFEVLSDIHRPINDLSALGTQSGLLNEDSAEYYQAGLPVVAFKFTDELRAKHPHIKQSWIQTLLRAKGWVVPNYELSPDCEKIQVLRVVVRETMTEEMVAQLVHDVLSISEDLEDKDSSSFALASLGQEQQQQQQQQGDDDHPKDSKTSRHHTHKHQKHLHLERNAARLAEGSGVKATGYSRQC